MPLSSLSMTDAIVNLGYSALNWSLGWCLLLAGALTGAALGIFMVREDFLGGYGSLSRRMARLGHIACAALGMLNLIVAIGIGDPEGQVAATVTTYAFALAGVSMPLVCFLTAIKVQWRHAFVVPVLAFATGAVAALAGGLP